VSVTVVIVHFGTVLYVQLRYNFRVYPGAVQREALARAFGCARVVYSDGLRARQRARTEGLPYISDGELSKQVITRARGTPERVWLGEVSSCSTRSVEGISVH
jgi:putative transposase